MKKILYIALAILIVLSFCACDLSGCTETEYIVYANEDSYTIGAKSYDDNITALNIEWIKGKVLIREYSGRDIILNECEYEKGAQVAVPLSSTDNFASDNKLRSKIDGTTIVVKERKSGKVKNPPEKLLVVSVPAHLQKIVVNTISAEIEILANSNEIALNTIDGEITVYGSFGKFNCTTVSSNTTTHFYSVVNSIDCSSTDGGFYMTIAPCDFTAKLVSTNGQLFVQNYNELIQDNTLVVNSGEKKYDFFTVTGNVSIVVDF